MKNSDSFVSLLIDMAQVVSRIRKNFSRESKNQAGQETREQLDQLNKDTVYCFMNQALRISI